MADWQDWLEGLGGAAAGVTQGLTAGAAPFAAWDRVVGSGLANESAASKLRNEQLSQAAREGIPDFYGNAAGAQDIGSQLAMSKGKNDIYGFEQGLAARKYMADPNDAFQQMVQTLGLTPADPQYRQLAAEAQSYYDPLGAIAGYDKMNIPGMQQQNLNEEAVLSYVTAFARKVDKGAHAFRAPNGQIMIMSSDGTEVLPAPDALVRSASMLAAKDPYAAVSAGVKDENLIARTNAELYKVMTAGGVTPAQQIKVINDNRVLWSGEMNKAQQGYEAIKKTSEYTTADPATQATMLQPYLERGKVAQQQLLMIDKLQQAVINGQLPNRGVPPSVASPQPQGQSSVNTKRLSTTDIANLAAGGAQAFSAAGAPPAGMPGYPTPRASPRDTGIRPITDPFGAAQGPGPMGQQDLEAYVQSLLQGE